MKAERIKGLIVGIIITSLMFGSFMPAYASHQQQAVLDYPGITITLDGEPFDLTDSLGTRIEPFTINGTTYLPLRCLASLIGLNVDWDGSTKTISLTTPSKKSSVDTTQKITTISELQSYLNLSMGAIETPLGKCTYTIEIQKPLSDVFHYDFEIYTRFDSTAIWYNLKYSNSYSDVEKAETLKILRDFQEGIYNIAIAYFPGKMITGCYYSSYYKYPYAQVGYTATRVLSWRNYVETDPYNPFNSSAEPASFHWYNDLDDYKYTY